MNSGVITLVVSGPVPGSVRGDAESATALFRELHARTILHVARPDVDEPTRGGESFGGESFGGGESSGGESFGVGDVGDPAGRTGDPAGRTGDPAGRTGDPAGRTGDPAGRTGDPAGPAETAERLSRLGYPGPKGTAGALAELVVTGLFSATTVAALAQVAVAFVQRGAARRIILRDGRRSLTISAPSEETERMVTEWLGVPPTQSGAGSGAD
ncbi:hypothetical protein ACFP2T_17180 [Plantactinospora solaniradicis]|uniref:Uncharacterized protein n=1 Tax=Plantactinospora solaniradicis TaxID=1723736 RepID=A0ABW1K9W1_9ACTN